MRIGMGYDVHPLVEGRDLILGGVFIPFEKGLKGHSDADVLVHAVMDALLGAAAMGDIGKLFPDTDERYRGISSLVLLRSVGELIAQRSYRIENIDSVVVAQRPRIAPYIEQMRENIARELNIQPDRVSVKATTTEGLGFIGAGDGIAAYAVALLA
ncbi:2-C-methyl-D-erythritol 2,4-cyclodiphosphate synthase [Caldicoprobacter algeriensis]|uniref:2-C-methyl-D-erythritol 2,4-cyclodiphosphate synthase n=1 Tax=Caldicoprobacter algeriensis TaxID=699281 RepID=UPI00207A89F9|nr:2-C-methyl-D-erythritol 2,4-cyclodiphosphate synthase [Caldicoprobacter algeriensis]MCM8901530.1 2-C-methyl-D-erythritol 2,4-cyclodiphosphate synthase [Caldicoprobacter algeriensis]